MVSAAISTCFFGKLVRHLSVYHENMPNFSIECVARNCRNNYTSVASLGKHVQRHHPNILQIGQNGGADDARECDLISDHDEFDDYSDIECENDLSEDGCNVEEGLKQLQI